MQTAQKTAPRKTYVGQRNNPPKKRIVKMEGNVAYINSGFAKKKVAQPAKVAKKEVKRVRAGLFTTIFVIMVAFGAMALLVSRYAAICQVGAANNEIEQNIEEIESKIEALQIDIELRDDLEYVQDTARDALGMTYPNQDQVIYIDASG
ncbi:MAG: hypothetical protein PHO15_08845 [Eubacteriales bacterium]|nr:hypothetical protein [Eubacteriales bacterium]